MAMPTDEELLDAADEQAELSRTEGGLPIGAVLVDPDGRIVAASRNQSVQRGGDLAAHAELETFRVHGATDLTGYTVVTTMAPCWMCAGAARYFGLSHVVVTAGPWDLGTQSWLAEAGVDVRVIAHDRSAQRFETWCRANPERWRPLPST
jgi:creatinine deaminase